MVYKWRIKLENPQNGKKGWSNFWGYKTKKEAQALAARYQQAGLKAEVVRAN